MQEKLFFLLNTISTDVTTSSNNITNLTPEQIQTQADITSAITIGAMIAIPISLIMILIGIIWVLVIKTDSNEAKISYKKPVGLIVIGFLIIPFTFIVGMTVKFLVG